MRKANVDEMFESCLFLHDREEILEVMSKYQHTALSMSKLHRPSDQCTLLMVACVAGDANLVDLLLEEGDPMVLLSTDDTDGNSPLLCACLGGHAAVVDVLLDDNHLKDQGDLTTRPNHEGTTPIIAAAWRGHLELVQKLCQISGVSLTAKDSLNRTAKDLAEEWGHKHVVEWIDNNLQEASG